MPWKITIVVGIWCALMSFRKYGNAMKRIAAMVLGSVCLGALSGVAADAQKVNPYSLVLSQAPPAELPARAAALVKKAKARDWSVTAVNVVKAALEARPASACAVVNSISKAVPEMAPIAAGTAAELQPKQAVAIAEAAADAAPSNADEIVAAVSRAVPGSYADDHRRGHGPPEHPPHPPHPVPGPHGPHNYGCP